MYHIVKLGRRLSSLPAIFIVMSNDYDFVDAMFDFTRSSDDTDPWDENPEFVTVEVLTLLHDGTGRFEWKPIQITTSTYAIFGWHEQLWSRDI